MAYSPTSDNQVDMPEHFVTGKERQREQRLRWGRYGCILVVLLVFGIFLLTLPTYLVQLQTLCSTPACSFGQLTVQDAHVLALIPLSLQAYSIGALILVVGAALLCLIVATLLLWRPADNWLTLLVALLLVNLGVSDSTIDPLVLRPILGPILSIPVAGILNYVGAIALPLILALFPNGRFVPRWTRWLVTGMLVIGILFALTIVPPLALSLFTTFFWGVGMLTLAGAQIYRYRRVATLLERQQMKWVIFGFTVAILIVFGSLLPLVFFAVLRQPTSAYYTLWSLIANTLLIVPIVVSLGSAILRYHLWDIDIILNRTLVYGTLTISIVAIYSLVIVALSLLLQSSSNPVISLIAAGCIAMVFQPLRERLHHIVNRVIYGERDEPYLVISRLGQRLEATLAPEAVFSVIVETVAHALKLPYAAIALKRDQSFALVAVHGNVRESLLHVPLLFHTQQIGELRLAPRARGETFTPRDHRLLDDLARQIGIAVHAVQLTTDLQHSRERLVTAREEERRRLRRDLHDGLGPALAGISLKCDAARNLLGDNPAATDAVLVDLKKQTQTVLGDIRRLVYALRPPSLDEMGLVAALQEQAEQYRHEGVQIRIVAEEPLPQLSAALEVATYRIVQEALTNVIRHAQAHTCTIHLRIHEGLHIQVDDDGCGIPTDHHQGVGLTSIRERTAELGGHCEIVTGPDQGAHIHVHLPLPKE